MVIGLLSLSACSKYQKLLKSTNYEKKYETAVKLYNSKDYYRALQLFDELAIVYRGKPQGELISYYTAYSYFKQGDNVMASYYFKSFSRQYPKSQYTEECTYMSAYCKYADSPETSLDQTSTYEAITELQLFINYYPQSKRVDDANKLIDELRAKLAQKAFDNAYLYYKTESYNAAQIAFQNVLKDFPETSKKEQVLYYILKSRAKYADMSVDAKKEERYEEVIKAYNNFAGSFPESHYSSEARLIYQDVLKKLAKYKQN